MKFTATILLFYFSFLAAQPVIPLLQKGFSKEDKCTMACCHKTQNAKPKAHPNNCCNNDMCNPFGQYACCIGFVVEKETSAPMVLENKYALFVSSDVNRIIGFCSDCWRPPESALS